MPTTYVSRTTLRLFVPTTHRVQIFRYLKFISRFSSLAEIEKLLVFLVYFVLLHFYFGCNCNFQHKSQMLYPCTLYSSIYHIKVLIQSPARLTLIRNSLQPTAAIYLPSPCDLLSVIGFSSLYLCLRSIVGLAQFAQNNIDFQTENLL